MIFFILRCHFVVKRRKIEDWGGLQCLYFYGEASLGRTLQPLLEVHEFLGGISGPVFPIQIPSLPVLDDSLVIAPPLSVAAQQGSCHQMCMLLDQAWGQAPLSAIFSFKKAGMTMAGEKCHVGYHELIFLRSILIEK